ncbi:MAG: biopolymer transporter ExbD, partial [Cyanobacteria bacterium P01_G01_bin.49]
MQFKQKKVSTTPEVNLVPMIDVLMSVLIFFIITSMTLTNQNLGNINLPNGEVNNQSKKNQENSNHIIVGLDKKGTIFIENKFVNDTKLIEEIKEFLSK